jgi:hypothetical protein
LESIHKNYNYDNTEFFKIIRNGILLKLNEDYFFHDAELFDTIEVIEPWTHSDHIIFLIKEKNRWNSTSHSIFVADNINYTYNFVLVK